MIMAVYSDAEMLLATQVAYLNLEPGADVSDAISAILNSYTGRTDLSPLQQKQLEVAQTAQTIIDNNHLTSYENWTIADTCNHESGSGFYGCLIDDGNGSAIIGCRGSESFDKEQTIKDWVVADVGLLNSSLTTQQADASEYMQYLYDNYGDSYLSFSITGHSLGGNLAEHCAVTAPAGMVDKIDHVINYDGPGYSDEYIAMHMDDIARVADKIDHYEYSWVGSFLTPLPGVGRQVIVAHNDPNHPGIPGYFYRHDTRNIELVDGHVQPGDKDIMQNIFGPVSRFLDYAGPEVFLFIPVVGPLLYTIEKANQVITFVGGVAEKVVRGARDVYDSISRFLGGLYDKFFGHEVSGEFEVNLSSLRVFPDELEGVAGRSEDIADDIRSIVSSLKYHSVSGAYYKNKLRRIARNIEKAGQYARRSGNVLSEVISFYGTRDADVAASYA